MVLAKSLEEYAVLMALIRLSAVVAFLHMDSHVSIFLFFRLALAILGLH